MDVISAVKPHACHSCDKGFGRRYNLRRHIDSVHADDSDESEGGTDIDHPEEHRFKRSRHYSETESPEIETDEDEQEDTEEDDSESETEKENDLSSDEDEPSSELEDNIAYLDWLEEGKEATNKQWNEKYEKYTNEGMSEDEAKDKANRKIHWALKRIFFDKYKDFLSSYLHLKDHINHLDIVEELEEKLDKGMDIKTKL